MSGRGEQPRPDGRRFGHQPASAEDLRQHPPAGPDCVVQRQLLRDYVDGDLDAEQAAGLEAHVHTCRSCGLALSRAEAEQLQLRDALDAAAVPGLQVPEDFGARLMRRLEAEWQVDVDAPAGAAAPSDQFTAKVMAMVREEALVSVAVAESRRLWGPVLLAATLLLGLGLGVYAYGSPARVPAFVIDAEAAQWRPALGRGPEGSLGASRPLLRGQGIPLGSELSTKAGGSLELALTRSGQDLRLHAAGLTRLRAKDQAPWRVELAEGDCEIDAPELAGAEDSLQLLLGDGSEVQLAAPGRFFLSSVPVTFPDERAGLRVRLAVESGQVQVRRAGEVRLVEPGWTLSFHSFSGMELERSPDLALWQGSRDAARAADFVVGDQRKGEASEPAFGMVLHPLSGAPVAGADVHVVTMLGPLFKKTGPDGGFGIEEAARLRGQLGLVKVVPPEDSEGLFGLPWQAVRLDPGAGPQRFVLLQERVCSGRLRAADDMPLAGATLQACVLDEDLRRVEDLRFVETGVDGGFRLGGLPERLGPGQRLLLLAGLPGAVPQVVWSAGDLQGIEDLDLRLAPASTAALAGLRGEADYQLFMAVPGALRAAVLQDLRSDAAGQLQLPRSLAWQFLRPQGAQAWQRVQVGPDGKLGLVPAGEAATQNWIRIAASDAALPWSWLRENPLLVHELPESDGQYLAVFNQAGRPCPRAQIYHVAEDGSVGLLGLSLGSASMLLPRLQSGDLLARSSDGLVAGWKVDPEDPRSHRFLEVLPPARLRIQQGEGGLLALRDAQGRLFLRPDRKGVAFLPAGTYEWLAADGGARRVELSSGREARLRR